MQEKNFKKLSRYKRILNKNTKYINFYKTAEFMLKNIPNDINYNDYTIYKTTVLVTAPTLISYVLYILNDAQKQNITRLYFLSRDGYVMYKIAMILCEKYNINIECRYLYCSRMALRASLYLIDKNEAIEKICEEGAKISIETVLKRAGISSDVQPQITSKLNKKFKDKLLSKEELNELKAVLLEDDLFDEQAKEYANKRYKCTLKYFRQEKLFEKVKYAIVDVGWLGSMQRHIRQILEYSGFENEINGYYFGMFENGKEEDGHYNCFYFSKDKNSFRRVLFNNNLFECLCSANHGMTTGYYEDIKGCIKPSLNKYKKEWNIDIQLNAIENFCEKFIQYNEFNNIKFNHLDFLVKKLIISLMMFPNKEEAIAYGSIPFCDDFTESYKIELAQNLSKEEFSQYKLTNKIYNRLLVRKNKNKLKQSFWINGSIQISDIKFKKIYNIGCILSEYIHYLIIHNLN